jgi:formyltetrahydrofolate deformylase
MTLQASWRAADFDEADIRAGLFGLAKRLGMEIRIRFTEPGRRQRYALLVTKETHCLAAILAAQRAGKLKAEAVVVIGNHPQLVPLAKKHRLPFVHIPWEDRAGAEQRTLELLDQYEVDFVVLARFMKILSPGFVWRYKNKIINIHPSLLPSFPGPQAYRQAYEHGVKIVGVTAHFVSMHLDEGPIIAQGSFQLRSGMSLKQILTAGQKLEAQVLVKAVRLYLTKRLDVYWGIVKEV